MYYSSYFNNIIKNSYKKFLLTKEGNLDENSITSLHNWFVLMQSNDLFPVVLAAISDKITSILFPKKSVGATENAIMAAVLAKGDTEILN